MQLQIGQEVYEFNWWHQVEMGLSPFATQDIDSVRLWLQRFRFHGDALYRFRLLLAQGDGGLPATALSDEEVLDQLAWRLRSGLVWTAARVELQQSQSPEVELAPLPPPPQAPPAAREAPSSTAPPPPDEDPTFPPNADLAAIIAVKKQAAQDGTPFCEECAKAAAQQARAAALTPPAPPPPPQTPPLVENGPTPFAANADLEAIVAAKKAAAEAGIPFCEECAKAAAAQGE